jgi:tRNA threonylcarbamoyladenosine biosynthesis protein TsaE
VLHLVKLLSRSAGHTSRIGKRIGQCLVAGDVVALTGGLGSGKSVLARGILRALGVAGDIPSPSFIIIANYEGRLRANHIDLYRLEGADEIGKVGIEEFVFSDGVSVVEWAEKAEGLLPASRLDVAIDFCTEPDARLITLRPCGQDLGARLLPLVRALMRRSEDDDPGD